MECTVRKRPVAALGITIILMCFFFMLEGFAPAGEKYFLTWDLNGQYAEFLMFFKYLLMGKADWNYSLTGGLGNPMAGLTAYYLASPFNLIMLFFTRETLPIGMMVLFLLKQGAMSFTICIYLNKKTESFATVICSVLYAFSSYVIAYGSNIMWLDALVFLPLVVMGIEKLVEEGRCALYLCSLFLTIFSNYYIGYMICLFSAIYYLGYQILFLYKKKDWKMAGKRVFQYAGTSILSAGLTAFLLFPMLRQLNESANRSHSGPDMLGNWAKLYFHRSLLPYLLSGSYDDSHRWNAMLGFPLLYCGILAVFGMILFYLNRKTDLSVKIFYGYLIWILLMSFCHTNLFIIWHGIYSPIGAPWRFAFLWSFVVLSVACQGMDAIMSEKSKSLTGAALIVILLFFVWIYWRFPNYRQVVVKNVVLFVPLCGILLLCKSWKGKRLLVAYGVFLLFLGVELYGNVHQIWSQGFTWESVSVYGKYVDKYEKMLVAENGAYRSQILPKESRTSNDGFLWNLKSLDQYSSIISKNAWDTFYFFGFGNNGMGYSYGEGSTGLSNALIGMKYLYAQERLEIQDTLPLGYVVKKEAADIGGDTEENLFELQNAFFHAIGGRAEISVYQKVGTQNGEKQGMIIPLGDGKYTDGYEIYEENTQELRKAIQECGEHTLSFFAKKDSNMQAKFDNTDGKYSYACFSVVYDDGWSAYVNGERTEPVRGMGGLLLVPIGEGVEEVRIRYFSKAQFWGIKISLISLACILFCLWIGRRKKETV